MTESVEQRAEDAAWAAWPSAHDYRERDAFKQGFEAALSRANTGVAAIEMKGKADSEPVAKPPAPPFVDLMEKIANPNGVAWNFPWRVVPVDGKPTIVGNKSGNLFRGYMGTWAEADLIVALLNDYAKRFA